MTPSRLRSCRKFREKNRAIGPVASAPRWRQPARSRSGPSRPGRTPRSMSSAGWPWPLKRTIVGGVALAVVVPILAPAVGGGAGVGHDRPLAVQQHERGRVGVRVVPGEAALHREQGRVVRPRGAQDRPADVRIQGREPEFHGRGRRGRGRGLRDEEGRARVGRPALGRVPAQAWALPAVGKQQARGAPGVAVLVAVAEVDRGQPRRRGIAGVEQEVGRSPQVGPRWRRPGNARVGQAHVDVKVVGEASGGGVAGA